MQAGGKEVDVRGATQGSGEGVDVPHAAALTAFAEAVVARDAGAIARGREALRAALGAEGLADAAATVAAFHGFVRVADATGIPYTTAARGGDAPEIRERSGVNAFYRVREEQRGA
jgi:hypothetical protein